MRLIFPAVDIDLPVLRPVVVIIQLEFTAGEKSSQVKKNHYQMKIMHTQTKLSHRSMDQQVLLIFMLQTHYHIMLSFVKSMKSEYSQIGYIILIPESQLDAQMVTFVWLEDRMQMKEEWRSAAMECGGLFILPAGTVLMLELLVGNWDYIRHIPVCIARHACMLELNLYSYWHKI